MGILRGWTAWVDLHEESSRPGGCVRCSRRQQDWDAEMRASAERAAQVLRAADERKRGTVEGELAQVRAELAEARAELARSAATATAAAEDERRALHERMEAAVLTKEEEAARELLERLEEEKERRVEHLQRVAARRIGLGAVARGWSAWHAAWEERRRQRQMLASAGARPGRSVAHWRGAWERRVRRSGRGRRPFFRRRRRGRRWSGCSRCGAGGGGADRSAGGGEGEVIAHLHQSAARRMGNQGILRGWTAWVDLHEEQRARRQMLASAGASAA